MALQPTILITRRYQSSFIQRLLHANLIFFFAAAVCGRLYDVRHDVRETPVERIEPNAMP
uniref:Uncharacterized protein n=1 Tax=Romanomermis culicivorax TaxID=13658 RepID=A0A915HEH8_ROMCU